MNFGIIFICLFIGIPFIFLCYLILTFPDEEDFPTMFTKAVKEALVKRIEELKLENERNKKIL